MREPTIRQAVAGLVRTECSCCPMRQLLVEHASLEPVQKACPRTGTTYLDRGDGVFEFDGGHLDFELGPLPPATRPDEGISLLSDRPRRSATKTRIELERATFANSWRK